MVLGDIVVKPVTVTIAIGAVSLCSWVIAEPLKIAAWNLEHLNADGSEGCIDRTAADFEQLQQSIHKQDFDVVAFQEVKDVEAAETVFPSSEWNIEMSTRPQAKPTLECWDAPGRFLQHLGTGFAIRKGLDYQRHEDFKKLGLDDGFQRWGTDISIIGDSSLRLLNVHLISGCWSEEQDEDEAKVSECASLKTQFDTLVDWRDARIDAEDSFLILGVFNRRLALEDDWGWKMLQTPDRKLRLLGSAGSSTCDPQYPDFIDHIVVGDLNQSLYVGDSFLEGPRIADHPDRCAVSADFDL